MRLAFLRRAALGSALGLLVDSAGATPRAIRGSIGSQWTCVAAFFASAGRPSDAWDLLEESFARPLLGEPCISGSDRLPLERIRQLLAPDEALIAWLDLDRIPGEVRERAGVCGHWAVAVRRDGDPSWVPLPSSGTNGEWSEDDDCLLERLRHELEREPGDASLRSELLEKARCQRIAPLEPILSGSPGRLAVRRLVVIRQGRMAGVPIEALTHEHVASYSPSGTIFARLAEKRDRAARGGDILIVGDAPPSSGAEGSGSPPPSEWPRLAGARREAADIGRSFDESAAAREQGAPSRRTSLLGPDATERALHKLASAGLLENFRWIHIATHASTRRGDRGRTSLILADRSLRDSLPVIDGRDSVDGELTAREILDGWRLDADLVTLSACATAGLGRDGEERPAFSEALLAAGARSLILTLWSVDDTATALLMSRFYRGLFSEHLSRAEALSRAKQWLRSLSAEEAAAAEEGLGSASSRRGARDETELTRRARGDRPYAAPYYWAAFILVGDAGEN